MGQTTETLLRRKNICPAGKPYCVVDGRPPSGNDTRRGSVEQGDSERGKSSARPIPAEEILPQGTHEVLRRICAALPQL